MLGNAEWERSEPLGFAGEVDAEESFRQPRPILERVSRTARMRRGGATVAAAVASALVLVDCDGDSSDEGGSDQQASTPDATTTAPMQPPSCAQTHVLRTGDIRGQATGATLWALPMAPLPFDAGREVKSSGA